MTSANASSDGQFPILVCTDLSPLAAVGGSSALQGPALSWERHAALAQSALEE